jgi:hypothetical protein
MEVVLKWINSKVKEEKSQPAKHDKLICLCFTMEKIPANLKTISYILVPHPLFPFDGSQKTCLIIGDGKEGLNAEVAKKKIMEEGLWSIKTIFSQVTTLLGLTFFSRKRNLIPLDLTHEQWRGQTESACTLAIDQQKTKKIECH